MTLVGSGTQSDPFIIKTISDFNEISNNLTAYYKLYNDIDFMNTRITAIMDFEGTLDGDGKKITRIIFNGGNYGGLIGRTKSTAIIKNLWVDSATSNGLYSGMIVGHNVGGVIENCLSSGSISGSTQLGGICGFNQGGIIRNCYNDAKVTGTGTSRIGSIAGRNTGSITKCYNIGEIKGGTGYTSGGICGEGSGITDCFWNKETSIATTSSGGTGKTTAEMKLKSTYTNWDFNNIWYSDDNSYPVIRTIVGIANTPTSAPIVTIISVDRNTISNKTGVNLSNVKFKFDTDVTQWTANVMGTSPETGVVADSGGSAIAGVEITAIIDWNELYQEGENRINIYGQNAIGWTQFDNGGSQTLPKIVTNGLLSYYHYKQGFSSTKWDNIAPSKLGQYDLSVSGATMNANGVYFDGINDLAIFGSFPSSSKKTYEISLILPNFSTNMRPFYPFTLEQNGLGIMYYNYQGYAVGWIVGSDSNGQPVLYNGGNSDTSLKQVAITVDFDNFISKLYINGILVGTASSNTREGTSDSPLALFNDGGSSYSDGTLKLLRVYNRVLSDSEILQNYNVGSEDVGL